MQTTYNKTGLSKIAYDQILELIFSRQLSVGEIIRERKLAESLNMSRTPVREALHQLEAESWLVRLNERTIAVKQITLSEYNSALQVRQILEPEAAMIATKKITDVWLKECRQKLNILINAKEPDPKFQWDFDEFLHMGIVKSTQNPMLYNIVANLRKVTQLFENQTLPEQISPGLQEHIDIVNALEKRDGETAKAMMYEHLVQAKQNILNAL